MTATSSPSRWNAFSPIDSPRAYAAAAAVRLWRRNVPPYLALTSAVALPLVVWASRAAITAEGQKIAGAEFAARLGTGSIALVGLATLIGLLQVHLLMSRVFQRRAAEYRLLMVLLGSLDEVRQVILWESVGHCVVGWVTGLLAATAAVLLLVHRQPLTATILSDGLVLLPVSLGGALIAAAVPALLYTRRVGRLANAGGAGGW